MPKVFIVNKSSHDFSDAARFGDLVFLSEGSFDPYSVGKMYREFEVILKHSSPEDYILPTGLSVMQIIVAAIFANMHHKLNLLLFSNGRYIERRIVL